MWLRPIALLAICISITLFGPDYCSATFSDRLQFFDNLPQLPFLSATTSFLSTLLTPPSKVNSTKRLQLRNVYHQGTHSYRGLSARIDIAPEESIHANELVEGKIRTRRIKTWKPKDITPYIQAHNAGDAFGVQETSKSMDWDEIEVDAPDVEDRETLLTLAKMASRAYDIPKNGSDKDWIVDGMGKWNLSESFGWVEDGIRGHIFATEDNSTIVVALKGTSAALLDDGATSKRDKENDNLFFSCCCAHVGWTWHTVCDCFNDGLSQQTCSSSCLTKALINKSFFYPATTDLFNNISYAYPDSQIWITGHSLGGALGALIGMTFGYPTVAFEAPAERMAAMRLHVPLPVKKGRLDALPITHVYNTADAIAMGDCVGSTSLCAISGFAMETRCHTGKTILYDTVGKLGWGQGINSHRIAILIEDLLDEDWDKKVAKANAKATGNNQTKFNTNKWHLPWHRSNGDNDGGKAEKLGSVPRLRDENDCVDCADWKFTKD